MPTPSDTNAATLFTTVCHEHVITPTGLVLHADTGGPMNGATMTRELLRPGRLGKRVVARAEGGAEDLRRALHLLAIVRGCLGTKKPGKRNRCRAGVRTGSDLAEFVTRPAIARKRRGDTIETYG